jgi:hypothetical protein
MKQLLAWTGSADSTLTSEAAIAMAEKFNTGQEVCLQSPSARGVMQVKEGTSGSSFRSRSSRFGEEPAGSSKKSRGEAIVIECMR